MLYAILFLLQISLQRNLNNVSIKKARLVILSKMMVNKVVQMKYNFDAYDPPRLHQMAPLSIQISKRAEDVKCSEERTIVKPHLEWITSSVCPSNSGCTLIVRRARR